MHTVGHRASPCPAVTAARQAALTEPRCQMSCANDDVTVTIIFTGQNSTWVVCPPPSHYINIAAATEPRTSKGQCCTSTWWAHPAGSGITGSALAKIPSVGEEGATALWQQSIHGMRQSQSFMSCAREVDVFLRQVSIPHSQHVPDTVLTLPGIHSSPLAVISKTMPMQELCTACSACQLDCSAPP